MPDIKLYDIIYLISGFGICWLYHRSAVYRSNEEIRLNSRKLLRIQVDELIRSGRSVKICKAAINKWWVTAIEDYGWFTKWNIGRHIGRLNSVNFPECECTEDIYNEELGYEDSSETYRTAFNSAFGEFKKILNKIRKKA